MPAAFLILPIRHGVCFWRKVASSAMRYYKRTAHPMARLEQIALSVQHAAVFYVDPANGCVSDNGMGPIGTCTLAQITVASMAWTATVNLHGRTSNTGDAQRWEQTAVTFSDDTPTPTVRLFPARPLRRLREEKCQAWGGITAFLTRSACWLVLEIQAAKANY